MGTISLPDGRTWDRGLALAIGVAVLLWSFAFVGIRYAIVSYTPGALALLRFVVASSLFAAYLLATPKGRALWRPSARQGAGFVVMGATGIFGYHLALNIGEQTVSAGAASLLVNTTPIFTVLLAAGFLGDRLGARGTLGVAIAFGGAALVSLGSGESFSLGAGAAWVLFAAVVQALYFVIQKKMLTRFNALELTAASSWCGCLLLAVFTPELLDALRTAPWTTTLVVLALGVGPSAIAYVTWAHVVSRLTVSRAVSFLYLVPALALVLGWALLGERPGLLALVGGAATIGGVALVHRRG